MSSTAKAKQLNILLEPDQIEMLNMLAKRKRQPKAYIVRGLIMQTYAMEFGHTPTCANGQQCKCPHMHMITHPSPPQPEPPNGAAA